jgi:MoxR-like ATPase
MCTIKDSILTPRELLGVPGAAGTGKTMLAQAIAGETGRSFQRSDSTNCR